MFIDNVAGFLSTLKDFRSSVKEANDRGHARFGNGKASVTLDKAFQTGGVEWARRYSGDWGGWLYLDVCGTATRHGLWLRVIDPVIARLEKGQTVEVGYLRILRSAMSRWEAERMQIDTLCDRCIEHTVRRALKMDEYQKHFNRKFQLQGGSAARMEAKRLHDVAEKAAKEEAKKQFRFQHEIKNSRLLFPPQSYGAWLKEHFPHPLALAHEEIVGASEDPQTGEFAIVRRRRDGSTVTSRGRRVTRPDGSVVFTETDEDGNRRETIISPSGQVVVNRRDVNGVRATTILHPDGRMKTTETTPEGYVNQSTLQPDGTVTTVRRDLDGSVRETVTQSPDGWVSRVDKHGNSIDTYVDDDGRITTIETERNGNRSTTVTDANGRVENTERRIVTPLEPGREYYEQNLGGTDWHDLPESLRKRYAQSENAMIKRELRAAELAEHDAKRKQKLLDVQSGDAAGDKELESKLTVLRAEQEEAIRRAEAWRAKSKRQVELSDARAKGERLRREYDEAIASGDKEAAARIGEQVDAHHEATMELYKFTEDEQREMERLTALRQKLSTEINTEARPIARQLIERDLALQDAKDKTTGVTKYLSVGSEMQQQTSRTTRVADRQRAEALARLKVIEGRLDDKDITAEQRKIYQDKHDMASLQLEGAERMLQDNARITAAGYAIDGAGLISGGIANIGIKKLTQALVKPKTASTTLRRRLFAETVEHGTPQLPAGKGITTPFGDVYYSTLGTADDIALARYHESVHSLLSPKLKAFRGIRADMRWAGYKRSSTLQYIEEALAESYAQLRVNGIRGLPAGIKFPIARGYVTVQALAAEGAVGTIVVGGTPYYVFHDSE
ncbi:MAG: hypothetical protein GY826_16380 [Fuerstiella sp.]|nr:hypothetical protein [Fuerstiella sp.]